MKMSSWGGVLFGWVALGCGSGSEGTAAAGAEAPPGSTSEAATATEEEAPRFTLEGRGTSTKTSSVLEVVEAEQVALSITGSDPSDSLLVIRAIFEGVEAVVGEHRWPIGEPEVAQVFAVGTVDGQTYQSVGGDLELSLTADRHSAGRFTLELAPVASDGIPGAPTAPSAPAMERPSPVATLTLVGSFQSEWTVTCYSFIRGFTGGHFSSDSAYCNSLTF